MMTESLTDLQFLTSAEVADLLKLNPQVVVRKLQHGEIPGYKIGKDWRVELGQLREWLESRSNQRPHSQREKIIKNFFVNGKLTHLPGGHKRKRYVLEELLKRFDRNRVYSEPEVNDLIALSYQDFCTVRREFIAEGMMVRAEGKYRVASSYKYLP